MTVTEAAPAVEQTLQTTEQNSAAYSAETRPLPSPELATAECIRNIYTYLAEQDKRPERLRPEEPPKLVEEIKQLSTALEETSDTAFYELDPEDYDDIRLASSLLLLRYWKLSEVDNETACLPDLREAACAAYVSSARVLMARAEGAFVSQSDATILEEEALPYLIAALATQAKLDHEEVTTPEISAPDSKWHREASELIEIAVNRREQRAEEEKKRDQVAEAHKRERKEATAEFIVAELLEYKNNIGTWPSWATASRIFSDNPDAMDILKSLYEVRAVRVGEKVISYAKYSEPRQAKKSYGSPIQPY